LKGVVDVEVFGSGCLVRKAANRDTFVSLVAAARGGVGKGVRPKLGESRRQILVGGEDWRSTLTY
jgi:hypothetical protein